MNFGDMTWIMTMAKCPCCKSHLAYSSDNNYNTWKCYSCGFTMFKQRKEQMMSREEAIEIFKRLKENAPNEMHLETVGTAQELFEMAIQSLSQEGGYCCRTCKHTRINKDGIWCEEPTCQWEQAVTNSEAQEPCDDAISREALVDDFIEWREKLEYTVGEDYSGVHLLNVAIQKIWGMPSVTQKPKTGHWIEHPEIETSTPEYLMFYECSECGNKQCFCKSDIHKKRFCSNCGAKMESEG